MIPAFTLRRRVPAGCALCLALGAAGAPAQTASPRLTLEEAVRLTLGSSAEIRSGEWDVEAQLGAVRLAQGAYDPLVWTRLGTVREKSLSSGGQGVPRHIFSDYLQYGFGVDRRFRSGMVVSPQLSFARQDAATAIARNEASAGVDLVMPLLRGRGGGLTSASERAAGTVHRASAHDLRHQRALSVLRSVTAYWQYVAALKKLLVLRGAEERAARLVDETRTLIGADARPAVDSISVSANLASKRSQRIAGEQAVTSARRALGLAMGVSADTLLALPLPDTLLPAVRPADPARVPDARRAVAQALGDRADLASARMRREAAHGLLRGARSELQPQLDLKLSVGYTGVEGGGALSKLVTPFSNQEGGYHAQLQLSYGLPLGNRVAAGQALRSTAADRQAEIALAELTRSISLDAATAVETLQRSVAELEQAAEAVRLHTASVEGEVRKFRLGTSTLFDVIFAEDGLTAATLAEIDGRLRALAALAQLRFETGALAVGETGAEVRVPSLTAWDTDPARP